MGVTVSTWGRGSAYRGVLSLHKLTAGDGYAYLTRQVAALDATDRGHTGLADYYTARGESPGRWVGSALADVDLQPGDPVTAEQMSALFGEGRHPNADALAARVLDEEPAGTAAALERATAATQLGKPFLVLEHAPEFRVQVARRFADANALRGVPQDWPLPAQQRARIRTEVGREMFTASHGRAPTNPRELSSFIARHSRASTSAVAGFDLTFSPVKSVSVLWAIAPPPVADQIQDAHHAAVADTLGWLERTAVYTRGGAGGVQQLDTTGMLAAAFDHRDSRAGDPDLHTHIAVSSKVRVRNPDGTPGRWLALDGRVLFKATVAASERYNTRLEAQLHRRLGLTFTERPTPGQEGRRTVREITGVPEELLTAWSTRRAAISARHDALAIRFQGDHGRAPTPVEAIKLAQQATLETRDAKHAPRSQAEQRQAWRAQAAHVLGGNRAVTTLVTSLATAARRTRARPPITVGQDTLARIADATRAVLEEHRSTWQMWHVRAEAERQARAHPPPGVDVDAVVEHVVAAVLQPDQSVPLGSADPVAVPDPLRRRDGTSVYEVAGSQLYTSTAVLAGEAFILDAAQRTGGRTVPDGDVDAALRQAAEDGTPLNTLQAHLVRHMATSGARVALAIAPAGSGKTTAMSALTRAWTASAGSVIGLAPSAVAAGVLAQDTGAPCDTLAALTVGLRTERLPEWAHQVDARTLLVVDEAGMAATRDLADTIRFALHRGASVRLVGDDQQLASVAAGGVLRDLKASVGAVSLSELLRFRDPAEGAASIAVRAGDTTAIGFYLDADRVHVGDLGTVTDAAYTAWAADRDAGRDALLLAPTRELATALNIRARAERLDRTPGPQVALPDGSTASAGDLVITRRNDRRLRTTATDWVKNGDRWTVAKVELDGRLHVVHTTTGRHLILPADYVAAHVQLGYATTVHGAQGVTADTCHTVATGDESRQQLYVALTRGREANHLHLVTTLDGDEHSVLTPDATHPLTAAGVLERILACDEAHTSATTTREQLASPAADLAAAHARYRDSLHVVAVHIRGPAWVDQLETAAEQLVTGITDSPAWPTLRGHLALLAAGGRDPLPAFTAALRSREIDTADDVAAVLDWRLDPTSTRSAVPGPLPWLPGLPGPLAGDPCWGAYLQAREQHVRDAAATVRAHAAGYTAATVPAWGRALLAEQHRPLLGDLAVFRAAHAVPDEDTRPAGSRQPAAAHRRAQTALEERAAVAVDTSYRAAWNALGTQVGLSPGTDPHWAALVEHLAALAQTGADAPALLRSAAAGRPLPDEYQAAALLWRVTGGTTPAAPPGEPGNKHDPARPGWVPALVTALGAQTAHQLLTDPRWPAATAAVTRALAHGIPAGQVLRHPSGPDGAPVPGPALTDALLYRALMLTDPVPDPDQEPAPPDQAPPQDLPLLPVPVAESTPLNLSPEQYAQDGPGYDHWLRTGDPHPPLPAETIPVEDVALPAAQLDWELWQAERLRQSPRPWELSDQQVQQALARADEATSSPVAPQRIAELNAHAARFYQRAYPRSWARTYVTDRLGTDLTDDLEVRPGYAPPGWTALTRYLRRHGATDEELLAAGLAKRASTGRFIDVFRDRLVLPLHDQGQVVGFVGRRNPAVDELEPGSDAAATAGPKYLNTPATVLYAKGEHLYGLAEHTRRLAAGATPVLVEGPLDALAVTLASPDHVGVASLGTALTDTQADALLPYLGTAAPGVIVATDGDLPGQLAAERDYWMLTARSGEPGHVSFPPGLDPASALQSGGPGALRSRLHAPAPLAQSLLDERLAHLPAADALPAALTVIAAGHPQHWVTRTHDLARRLHVPLDVALTHLLGHLTSWDQDRRAVATTQISASREVRDRLTSLTTIPPARRWAPLVRQIDPALLQAADWASLAEVVDRAHQQGHDVHRLLPALAAQPPLSGDRPANDLRYRLLERCDLAVIAPPHQQSSPSRPLVPSQQPAATHAQRAHPSIPASTPGIHRDREGRSPVTRSP